MNFLVIFLCSKYSTKIQNIYSENWKFCPLHLVTHNVCHIIPKDLSAYLEKMACVTSAWPCGTCSRPFGSKCKLTCLCYQMHPCNYSIFFAESEPVNYMCRLFQTERVDTWKWHPSELPPSHFQVVFRYGPILALSLVENS